jgi:beta-phosphoglucomutase
VIRAVVFDLDGTLVQTEQLKALSYARAAVQMCPKCVTEEEVVDAYKEVVGLPRRDVALALMRRFGLEEAARTRAAELGLSQPWQAFVQVRLEIYHTMLRDPDLLRNSQRSYTVELLREARRMNMKTALATTSRREDVDRVLKALDLTDAFDFVATAEDVENTKPDPEVYFLASCELDVPPAECLVIEDSAPGVTAAISAGMSVIATTTAFTESQVHELSALDPKWIVDDSARLQDVFAEMLSDRRLH